MNTITVHLKKLSGDIVSITYDSSKESIQDIINRDIMSNGYKGYCFQLFKDGEDYNPYSNLKDGDILDFFIGEKNFEVFIFFLDEALMYKSENDNQAWVRGEFYNKNGISILEEYKKIDGSFSWNIYDYSFYNREQKYILSKSIKVLNNDSYDDEEHIMLIEGSTVFSTIDDMMIFIFRDIFEHSISENLINKINCIWNK